MKHLFLIFIALISTLFTSPSTQCNALTRKLSESPVSLTCRKTSDFGFCAYTIGSDPRSKGGDTPMFARIALDKLEAHAKDTSDYVHELQGGCVGKEVSVVGTCIQLYGQAAGKDVPAALSSLNGKAYGAAKQAAGQAMNDGQGCQQQVSQNPSPKFNKLIVKNKYTHDLSQLASDLLGLCGH